MLSELAMTQKWVFNVLSDPLSGHEDIESEEVGNGIPAARN